MEKSSKISKNIKIRRRNKNPNPIIDEDIVFEVLSRLPVKSLLRFRCVSKSWCSLISSKYFVKTHLENSKRNTNFTYHSLILTHLLPDYSPKICSMLSILCESSVYANELMYPRMNDHMDHPVNVVGCCDGLCCIVGINNNFYLYNPSTRKYKRLPDVVVEIDKELSFENNLFGPIFTVEICGFGFDECNDDYKVMVVLSYFWTGRKDFVVKVYSLKMNSWKTVEDFKYSDGLDHPFGKYVNGKLHWELKVMSELKIMSFDFGSEMRGIVEPPRNVEGQGHPQLGVLDGCLSLVYDYRHTHVDVWVMKEYGVKKSF